MAKTYLFLKEKDSPITGLGVSVPVLGMVVDKKDDGEKKPLLVWFLKSNNSIEQREQDILIRSFLTTGRKFEFVEYQDIYNISKREIYGVNGSLEKISQSPSNFFKKAIQVVYGDIFEMQKMIFLKKNVENPEEDLNQQLLKMFQEKIPVPIEEEWSQDFFNEFRNHFVKKLEIIGKVPFKEIYFLNFNFEDLSHVEKIEEIIIKAHGKKEFEKEFKRAPQIQALWFMINKKNFVLKKWLKFLERFGGKDEFLKLPFKQQVWYVYMYELFGEKAFEIVEEIKKTEHSRFDIFSLTPKAACVDLAKKGVIKSEDKNVKAIKMALEIFKEGNIGVTFLSFLNAVFANITELQNIKNKKEIIEVISKVAYNPKPGAEGIAMVAAELLLSESHYRDYEEEYLKHAKNIIFSSRSYPTTKGVLEGTDYSWEAIDMGNPRAWFVGLETNCCQHLHSAGSSCVLYAAKQPRYSGIFRVMKKKKTIAQSWFWFNQETGDFVFDNIEVLGGEVRDSIWKCYLQYIERDLAKYAKVFGIKRVCVGLGYNDMESLSDYPYVDNPTKINSMPDGRGVYSDADRQVLIKTFDIEEKK